MHFLYKIFGITLFLGISPRYISSQIIVAFKLMISNEKRFMAIFMFSVIHKWFNKHGSANLTTDLQ